MALVVLLGGRRVGLVVDIVRVKVLKHSKAKLMKDLWIVAKGKRLIVRRHFWICRIDETVGRIHDELIFTEIIKSMSSVTAEKESAICHCSHLSQQTLSDQPADRVDAPQC